MNKKIIIAIGIAIMLVPAVLAIILYRPAESTPPEMKDIVENPEKVTGVTITDANSNIYSETDEEEIKFLTELINGTSVQSTSVPEQISGFKQFLISFTKGDTVTSYRFYMSDKNPDQVYFKDEENKWYKADGMTSRTFMLKPYAKSLYDIDVPTLRVGDAGVLISPAEIAWNYKTIDGAYTPYQISASEEVKEIDQISKKTLGVSFSRTPSNVVISVADNGETLYSKLLEDFTGIETNEAKYYEIQLHAKWDDESYYGEAKYRFKAYIKPDAEFSFSSTDVQQGGIIKITAKNASSAGMEVECTPALKDLPKFYDDGSGAVAYLGTSCETEAGDYMLKLTYDGIVYEQTITVREAKYNSKKYMNKESVISATFSDDNLLTEENAKELVFTSSSASGLICAGETPAKPTKRNDHKTGYGIYISFDASDLQMRHDGIDYDIAKGGDVKAILSGTVVYVGNLPIHGGTIVIDHGNGIRSWYCRVDTSMVEQDQTVSQGDLIARTDDSGFGDSSRMHLGISVGRTFINPLWMYDYGLPD